MDAIGATGRIATCYAYRDAHEEMLRALNDLAVHAKEVRSLEGLVPGAAFFGFGCSR